MEQNSKYFSKTMQALDNLRQNTDELAFIADGNVETESKLKENIGMLRREIRLKADRIDSVITTLNGALE